MDDTSKLGENLKLASVETRERSCTGQTIEQSIEWNSSLYVNNFVDYEKAFDSLDRETLKQLMRYYAILKKFVILIRNTDEGMAYKVTQDLR